MHTLIQELKRLDTALFRNYGMFLITLAVCAGILIYILIAGEREISSTQSQVTHTHDVITKVEVIATQVEGMLAAQRGYIITGKPEFMDNYKFRRNRVSAMLAELNELFRGNGSQISRLEELRHSFNAFSTKLEERAQRFSPLMSSRATLENVAIVNNLKDNIIRINNAILEEEYSLLDFQVQSIERKKSAYFTSLLFGLFAVLVMLSTFNGFFLYMQRRHSKAKASLKETQERFALAIEGTRDGVFDWDMVTGRVFYSGRFFEMLGYRRGAFEGSLEDFKALLHPDDLEKVWSYMDRYLSRELPEYSQDFRLKKADGEWAWVNARAKAVFGADGKPLRMVGSHTDITHMKEYEEKLKKEKEQAEASNQAKSDFLAHMSHEIRTPLTAISGVSEILEKRKRDFDQKHKTLIETLGASVAILKDIINDILDFSKIESRELELDNASFEVGGLFDKIASMMSIRAKEKKLDFVFDYRDVNDVVFYGDEARLRQILINLISNAIKFTESGKVSVRAYQEAHQEEDRVFLRIDVADTGIGISPENFELIFERFKQADASVSRKYGGTGLGLPISRNLARLMGGDVTLTSEPGKGSTFSILLPLPEAEDAAHAEDAGARLSKAFIEKITAAASDETEQKILLVEDYDGNVVVLGFILDDMGCPYDVAKTGREALDLWGRNAYSLILMDIQMPEMDGLTATKMIREAEEKNGLKRTPIIGMTAHALIGDRDKCIEAGMDAYLPKPIVEGHLRKEILKYVGEDKKAA